MIRGGSEEKVNLTQGRIGGVLMAWILAGVGQDWRAAMPDKCWTDGSAEQV